MKKKTERIITCKNVLCAFHDPEANHRCNALLLPGFNEKMIRKCSVRILAEKVTARLSHLKWMSENKKYWNTRNRWLKFCYSLENANLSKKKMLLAAIERKTRRPLSLLEQKEAGPKKTTLKNVPTINDYRELLEAFTKTEKKKMGKKRK